MTERSLSISIPTHHGRAPLLAEALSSIAGQTGSVPGWDLEVCVSDNASHDGTEEVVRAFERESGIPVTYCRNEHDLGLGANILQAVELASGHWCWPIGSDDHLAGDALLTMIRLLEAHPDATGVTQPRENFTADMSHRLEPDRPAFYPLLDRTTVYRGAEDVVANLGHSWAYMGCHVVRRDRWAENARIERAAALAHPVWPQVYLMGRLAQRHPKWVWYPTPLIKSRADNSFYTDAVDARRDVAEVHAEVVAGLSDVWAELANPGSRVHGELTYRTFRVWAAPEAVRYMKSRPGHGLAQDVALLRSFVARFWRVREFWRTSAPLLVMPAALQRAIAARRLGGAGPMHPLPATALRAAVSASVPSFLPARRTVALRCTMRNEGSSALLSAPPNPVHLAYRWYDEAGSEVLVGLRTELPGEVAPREEITRELRVLTPWEPGRYELRVSPVQELVAWFDDVDEGSGARFPVDIGLAPVEAP